MKSIFHICSGIAAAILLSSSADAQNYKVFEKYRQFLGDPKPPEGNDSIDLDEVQLEVSKRRNDFIRDSGRQIAFDNHHRNQIAMVDPNHPLLPPTDTTLTTGLFHTCAITKRTGVDQETCGGRACGPVKCWGHDGSGQSSPPPGAVFTQISAGGYFTCGIRVEGDLVCWGEIDKALKSTNHLDEATKEQTNSDERHRRRLDKSEYKDEIMKRKSMAKEEHKHSLFSPNGAGKHIQVSSGMKHACAISRDLSVHCWGRNDFGESSPPSGKFVQVSCGNSVTCGLHPNGAVECWGKNNNGQSTPPNKHFQQISTSNVGDHACGILVENSTVHCWGDNTRGQTESQQGMCVSSLTCSFHSFTSRDN